MTPHRTVHGCLAEHGREHLVRGDQSAPHDAICLYIQRIRSVSKHALS